MQSTIAHSDSIKHFWVLEKFHWWKLKICRSAQDLPFLRATRTPEWPENIKISYICMKVSHITTLSHLMRKISLTGSTYNLGLLKTDAPPSSAHQMVYMPGFNLDWTL